MFGLSTSRSKNDVQSMVILLLALVCAILPLDLSQLAFGIFGVLAYTAVQATKRSTRASIPRKVSSKCNAQEYPASAADQQRINSRSAGKQIARAHGGGDERRALRACNEIGKQDVRQESVQPVSAPTFNQTEFDDQVNELVERIAPSEHGEKVVKELAAVAKRALQSLLPDADVVGFATGDVIRGTAFGVAIPSVDIVVNVSPSVLAERLRNRVTRPLPHACTLDARKLQKSALRACTDELVSIGGFKFRRSAFKGDEPKVTILAPASLGVHSESIPIDFSVNTATPFYTAALLTESGQFDPRARDLILIVRRWAKDRGISHAAKGHLSPYAWTLLAVYFLQVSDDGQGSILPSLGKFKLSSVLLKGRQQLQQLQQLQAQSGPPWKDSKGLVSNKSVAELFKDFVSFYNSRFDWRKEAVSVRMGRRAGPELSLQLHIVVDGSGSTVVGPSIEDPFVWKRNLSSCMTVMSISRLREEFARADDFCKREASLSDLLEPWVPPESVANLEAVISGTLSHDAIADE